MVPRTFAVRASRSYGSSSALECESSQATASGCAACMIKGERVVDDVPHNRAVAMRRELVAVMPQPVGSPDLSVDERQAGVPLVDLRGPPQRHPVHAQAVLDQRAGAHRGRLGRQDLELQPRRRDRLEIPRAAEEREDLVDRARHDLGVLEDVRLHVAANTLQVMHLL
jgi:hypothetical protein